jgi:tetratricopeptide (TPR) repeat protein
MAQMTVKKKEKSFGLEAAKILLLVLITSFAYSNTLHNQFVFDDSRIYLNPHIRLSNLDVGGLAKAWQKSEPRSRPLANTSFAVNYFFHQDKVFGYHLVNIAIHIVTGIFLFLLIKTTLSLPALRSRYQSWGWLPFVSALLWLVHPVQSQSVTYIIQRMNSLAALFYVVSLFAYVRGRLAKRWWWKLGCFGAAAGAGLLAFWSKEIALTLPFFILLYDWYFLQDLECGWLKKHGLLVGGTLGLLVAAAFFFYYGADPFSGLLAGYGSRDFTMTERLLTEARVLVFYLSLLLFPFPGRLNLDHDFVISQSLLAPVNTILSLALLAFLLGAALVLARRQRLLSFGIIWFLGNLAIESTVVPLEIVFEHRLYLPAMMLILAFVAFWRENIPGNYVNLAMVVMVVLVLLFWTYQRNGIWVSPISLWSDCVAKSPDKARVHSNLGVALKRAGRLPAAESHFLETIRLDRNFFEAYNNLGNIRFMQGRFAEAITFYGKALEIKPNIALVHVNLGHSLVDLWRLPEAREHYRKALSLDPANAEARDSFYRVGRMLAARRPKGLTN